MPGVAWGEPGACGVEGPDAWEGDVEEPGHAVEAEQTLNAGIT